MTESPLVSTRALTKRFLPRGAALRARGAGILAVDDVSLQVRRGSTLGVVGESGSGKTTLGRMIVGLTSPTSGRVLLDGTDTTRLPRRELHRHVQYVFQDPFSSLNPRHTIRESIAVPLRHLAGEDARSRRGHAAELMEVCGLAPELGTRYPHQLSGGQRQRVVIARAIAARPDVLVLDEPVSALDVSVQAQILALLRGLQERFAMAYVFISHDLAVVENLCDEVAVMSGGRVVEHASRHEVFSTPSHPYTRKLLAAVPGSSTDGRRPGGRRHHEQTPGAER